jgi:hypothetical protein
MADTSSYRTLLVAFPVADEKLKSSSENFAALLASGPAGLTDDEHSVRVASASATYETAREEFAIAAANMNEFLDRPDHFSPSQHSNGGDVPVAAKNSLKRSRPARLVHQAVGAAFLAFATCLR